MTNTDGIKPVSRKRLAWTFIAAAASILAIALAIPAVRGELALRKDLLIGQPKYFLYGEPVPHENELRDQMKERYGITLIGPYGCIVTSSNVRKWNAYNKAANRHFGSREGDDIFSSVLKEILDRHKQQ